MQPKDTMAQRTLRIIPMLSGLSSPGPQAAAGETSPIDVRSMTDEVTRKGAPALASAGRRDGRREAPARLQSDPTPGSGLSRPSGHAVLRMSFLDNRDPYVAASGIA